MANLINQGTWPLISLAPQATAPQVATKSQESGAKSQNGRVFCPSPARGEISVAQGGAPAEPWVCDPIPSLLPLPAQAGRAWEP